MCALTGQTMDSVTMTLLTALLASVVQSTSISVVLGALSAAIIPVLALMAVRIRTLQLLHSGLDIGRIVLPMQLLGYFATTQVITALAPMFNGSLDLN